MTEAEGTSNEEMKDRVGKVVGRLLKYLISCNVSPEHSEEKAEKILA